MSLKRNLLLHRSEVFFSKLKKNYFAMCRLSMIPKLKRQQSLKVKEVPVYREPQGCKGNEDAISSLCVLIK